MANPEHIAVLKQGVAEWNRWRDKHPEQKPDLMEADLRAANLSRANLSGANLNHANLSYADLREADLREANVRKSNVRKSNLAYADLRAADFSGANLRRANLHTADLFGVDLRAANLSRANLRAANLFGADLRGADLSETHVASTAFANVDFSDVKGLDTIKHHGPSTVGIDTIHKSRGAIPEVFLRGAGVPEPFITNMKSLVAAMSPIQFYSCFISYSTRDQEFADRLRADLQAKGVRCWLASEDLKTGDRFRDRIDESIRVHDKLLLVLSEHSVKSAWVRTEVEAAFEREHRQDASNVLFPVRLDEAVMDATQAWAADIRRTRHICSFTGWKNHDLYQKAFERLLRDLKAETTT